jgi:hypothetical protein
MIPDCIDPEAGILLRKVTEKAVAENVAECWGEYDFFDLWELRLHWSGCPRCRTEFRDVPRSFAHIGIGLENRCKDVLSRFRSDFFEQNKSLLAAAKDLPSAHPEIIARWAMAEDEVFPFLAHGQEAVSLRTSTAYSEELQTSSSLLGPINLSSCQEFFRSLEFDVQRFVFAVVYSRDLLTPAYEKIHSEHGDAVFYSAELQADLQLHLQSAITNSGLAFEVLYEAIEIAATGYSILVGGHLKDNTAATVTRTDPPGKILTLQEAEKIQIDLQELKRDFNNSVDSLKAGQMELSRQIERNRRPASSYEPYIAEQLGMPLYSRLSETSQRALQLAEHFYQINQEPDGFSPTTIKMAQSYECELALRVIWPFVHELLDAGAQNYDARGISKEPLICFGKVRSRGFTLGTLAWYLGRDPVLRNKALGLGFNAEAISKDAAWVGDLRNKAAHDFTCGRAAADDLRKRILCRDGIFSRLHPR